MYVVGLTGGIGSGKSTVAKSFEQLGIELVDTDLLAREVVLPGSPALKDIERHFGAGVITDDGELNRAELRKIVFANPAEKEWLESLLHPLIAKLLTSRLINCESPYSILVSPLLLETQQRDLTDRILVVDVSEQTQIERTLLRDDSDEQTIRAIIASQISREERLDAADDVLNNEQSLATLGERVADLHSLYLELAEKQ